MCIYKSDSYINREPSLYQFSNIIPSTILIYIYIFDTSQDFRKNQKKHSRYSRNFISSHPNPFRHGGSARKAVTNAQFIRSWFRSSSTNHRVSHVSQAILSVSRGVSNGLLGSIHPRPWYVRGEYH